MIDNTIDVLSHLAPLEVTRKPINTLGYCVFEITVFTKRTKIRVICACVQMIVSFLCGFLKKYTLLLVSISCLISLLYVSGSLIFNI